MPTGYTAGIIDGEIKDFKEFATLCTRAFLAHLRDEPFNSAYKRREPTDYHMNVIVKAKKELKEVKLISDKKLITIRKKELVEQKKEHEKKHSQRDLNKIKMNSFLEKAKSYKPPTKTHEGIAKFMIKQLEDTIDFDFSDTYHLDRIDKINQELNSLDATKIREEKIKSLNYDISYHQKEHKEELKRCEDINKWYDDFINSLNN